MKDMSNAIFSKYWPLILGVRGGSIRNMALYLLSCQWAKSRRLTSVWIFTHVKQPGSFTVFTTAFPWLQSTPQQKKLCHGLTRQRIFSPGIFMTINTLKRGGTKSNPLKCASHKGFYNTSLILHRVRDGFSSKKEPQKRGLAGSQQ